MASQTRKRGRPRSCSATPVLRIRSPRKVKKRKQWSIDSKTAAVNAVVVQQALLTAVVQTWRILNACQQEHILVDVKTRLTRPLTGMYAMLVIQRLRTTNNSALDWNGYSVYVGGGSIRRKICGIEIDDKGRELFCPFCVFHVINWLSQTHSNNKKGLSIHHCTGDLRKCKGACAIFNGFWTVQGRQRINLFMLVPIIDLCKLGFIAVLRITLMPKSIYV